MNSAPPQKESQQKSATCAAALSYAAAGLLVFPAPQGAKMSFKAARFYGGRRWGATTDPEEIRADWTRWPMANVCIVTGEASGVFVVDVDAAAGHAADGANTLARWPALPLTRTAGTPSGGKHFYFLWPNDGRVVRNDTGIALGAGVDVRGEGGMVVAPPSVKGDQKYRWLNTAPMARAPEWLLQRVAGWPLPVREMRADDDEAGVAHPELIAAALKVIPVELEWGARNRVGMAVWRACDGSESGFVAWDDWLRRSGRYDGRAARARWTALGRSRPSRIGAGTLIWLAHRADDAWLERLDRELMAELNEANHDAG